jgi:hypothetical protein
MVSEKHETSVEVEAFARENCRLDFATLDRFDGVDEKLLLYDYLNLNCEIIRILLA